MKDAEIRIVDWKTTSDGTWTDPIDRETGFRTRFSTRITRPQTCRTQTQTAMRRAKMTPDGIRCVNRISMETSIKYATIQRRLDSGWSPERALLAAVGSHMRMKIALSRIIEVIQSARVQTVEVSRSRDGRRLTLKVDRLITTKLFEELAET